ERGEPRASSSEFVKQRNIHQVTGERDVIGTLRRDIADNCIQRIAAMNVTPFVLPMEEAKDSFGREFGKARSGQRCEVRVRRMCQGEHASLKRVRRGGN